jgi:hypothetical protein
MKNRQSFKEFGMAQHVKLLLIALWILALLQIARTIRADDPASDAPQSRGDEPGTKPVPESNAKANRGVQLIKPNAFHGYTLIFPLQSNKTYLIDMQGKVVNEWTSKCNAGQEAYLLENGNLLRAAKLADGEAIFAGAAQGGRVQEFTWEGQLVWDFKFHNPRQLQHHAITRLPNGNVLLVVWERKTPEESIEAGVNPKLAGSGEILVDSIVEVKPKGTAGGEIVWEWHLWNHLIQDHDRTKDNFGDVAAHPELVDANFARNAGSAFANLARFAGPPAKKANEKPAPPKNDERKPADEKDDALNTLKGLGYIGASGGRKFEGFFPDWNHVNGISYNAKLDQIMISPREFNEFWIIDHSTTKAEAAGHTGGRSGRGGDLLYRWGNPRAYRAGTAADQRLFSQHDTHWIPPGFPGEGHVLVFNNGGGRPGGNHSSVDEVVLPVSADGSYEFESGKAYGPDHAAWSYTAEKKSSFFAALMSGAQRLPNGNTLICTGFSGTIFEVTPEKETVWDFINPAKNAQGKPGAGPAFGGFFGFGGGRGGSPVFRAYRYGADYPGLAGRTLAGSKTIEELEK